MSPHGTSGVVTNGGTPNDLEYAEKLNSDPQRLKFALRLFILAAETVLTG
jgi:hypothetical protein